MEKDYALQKRLSYEHGIGEAVSSGYSGGASRWLFSMPSEAELAYADLLFSVCKQFGICYYSATPKDRYFVEGNSV